MTSKARLISSRSSLKDLDLLKGSESLISWDYSTEITVLLLSYPIVLYFAYL